MDNERTSSSSTTPPSPPADEPCLKVVHVAEGGDSAAVRKGASVALMTVPPVYYGDPFRRRRPRDRDTRFFSVGPNWMAQHLSAHLAPPRKPVCQDIQRLVLNAYRMESLGQMLSLKRRKNLPLSVAVYLAVELTCETRRVLAEKFSMGEKELNVHYRRLRRLMHKDGLDETTLDIMAWVERSLHEAYG